MASTPPTRPAARGSGRRRRTLLIILATSLLMAGAVPFFDASADAVPPLCPDGSPPPCEDPDPDPTPTTQPPPTGPPTNPAWSARVSVLDQNAPASFNRTVTGSWGRNGSPSYSTPSGTVVWTDTAKLEGTIGLAQATLPAGSPGSVVGFRLLESQSSGRLCRSVPYGSILPTGRSIHVLVGAPIDKTPQQLTDMAAGVKGTFHPDGDTSITVNAATLVPQAGGLLLDIAGTLWHDVQWPLPNVDATFTYKVLLHLHPSTNLADPNEVMRVSADVGDLRLHGNGWTDDAEIWWRGNVEPEFRTNVAIKATTAVNASVSSQVEVQWFRSLGYTVSVRSLTTSSTGLRVFPSLCKVD